MLGELASSGHTLVDGHSVEAGPKNSEAVPELAGHLPQSSHTHETEELSSPTNTHTHTHITGVSRSSVSLFDTQCHSCTSLLSLALEPSPFHTEGKGFQGIVLTEQNSDFVVSTATKKPNSGRACRDMPRGTRHQGGEGGIGTTYGVLKLLCSKAETHSRL